MKSRNFITVLFLTLIIFMSGTLVQLHTLRTDIHILQIQNGTLTDEIVSLKLAQERTDSRLRYTVTVKEIEPIIAEFAEFKLKLDNEVATNFTLNEIMKQMFGKEVWNP